MGPDHVYSSVGLKSQGSLQTPELGNLFKTLMLALSICNILLKVIVYLIKFYYASEQFNPDFVKDLNKIHTNVQSPLDCFDMYVCLLSNCKSQVLTNQEEEGQISPFSQIFPNNSQHFLQTLKTILQILKMS